MSNGWPKRILRWVLWMIGLVLLLVVVALVLFTIIQPKSIAESDSAVGLQDVSLFDKSRERALNVYFWYPATPTGKAELFDSNAVFHGFSAIKNAPLQQQTHPLVVLSHGSGGNRGNQGWLAVELAKRGAIVIAANHPGSTSRDSAPATNILAWNRPLDIKFLLESILSDDTWSPLIDQDKIAVIGHSLGGYTVLAAAGGQLSLDEFRKYCQAFPKNPDCEFYNRGGVDLLAVDSDKFNASYKDDRISAVISIDPAYARSFQPASLADLPPALVITPVVEPNTIDDLQVGFLNSQLNEKASGLKIDGAHHFSFLPECKPLGKLILSVVEKGAHVLCAKEKKLSRKAIHEQTLNEVVTHFEKNGIF